MSETIEVKKDTRLEQLLKYAGIYDTGGQAKLRIQEGAVRVNGAVETRRGYRLADGDIVEAEGVPLKVKISA
ncbi:MAG: RNA-binding S4 domain-containing protein [Candidatus Aquicultorales bacterium]